MSHQLTLRIPGLERMYRGKTITTYFYAFYSTNYRLKFASKNGFTLYK
jgi:hypothetical protein